MNVYYWCQPLSSTRMDKRTSQTHICGSGDCGVPDRCCRLCGSDNSLHRLDDSSVWEGVEETYEQLLYDCFGVRMSSPNCMICEQCVCQLRSTMKFRALVQAAFEVTSSHSVCSPETSIDSLHPDKPVGNLHMTLGSKSDISDTTSVSLLSSHKDSAPLFLSQGNSATMFSMRSLVAIDRCKSAQSDDQPMKKPVMKRESKVPKMIRLDSPLTFKSEKRMFQDRPPDKQSRQSRVQKGIRSVSPNFRRQVSSIRDHFIENKCPEQYGKGMVPAKMNDDLKKKSSRTVPKFREMRTAVQRYAGEKSRRFDDKAVSTLSLTSSAPLYKEIIINGNSDTTIQSKTPSFRTVYCDGSTPSFKEFTSLELLCNKDYSHNASTSTDHVLGGIVLKQSIQEVKMKMLDRSVNCPQKTFQKSTKKKSQRDAIQKPPVPDVRMRSNVYCWKCRQKYPIMISLSSPGEPFMCSRCKKAMIIQAKKFKVGLEPHCKDQETTRIERPKLKRSISQGHQGINNMPHEAIQNLTAQYMNKIYHNQQQMYPCPFLPKPIEMQKREVMRDKTKLVINMGTWPFIDDYPANTAEKVFVSRGI